MRADAERRSVVAVADQFGICRVTQIMDGEAAVTPSRITEIAGADEVVQCRALAERGRRCFAAAPVHPREPPAARQFGLAGIRHIDYRQCVIDEPLEMHRDVGIPSANPPDTMRAKAWHCQKCNFAWACRFSDVENA